MATISVYLRNGEDGDLCEEITDADYVGVTHAGPIKGGLLLITVKESQDGAVIKQYIVPRENLLRVDVEPEEQDEDAEDDLSGDIL